jgi:hypothetical protein
LIAIRTTAAPTDTSAVRAAPLKGVRLGPASGVVGT